MSPPRVEHRHGEALGGQEREHVLPVISRGFHRDKEILRRAQHLSQASIPLRILPEDHWLTEALPSFSTTATR